MANLYNNLHPYFNREYMLSFWEREHFLKHDFIIVGGGIVGLSSAASIKESSPSASVLVLERGIFPTGASTKNAGFACFGSLTELLSDVEVMGEDTSFALVEERWKGLLKLRSRLGDQGIGFLQNGGYEIIREKEAYCLNKIDQTNNWLRSLFDKDVFSEKKEAIKTFGFNNEGVKSVIYNPLEGQIDTGKMMRSLIAHVQSLGVNILTGAEVQSYEDSTNGVAVVANSVEFKTDQLIICTNAFSKKLVPEEDITPGRGIVLVTKPIDNLKFKGVFHYDEGYFYFRNHGDRVIFGGGRNLDFDGEATDEFSINEQILNVLKTELDTMILPDQTYEIDQTWAGIMAFGKTKQPILKQVSDHVIAGVRLGGMGVAIGSRMGERIAEMCN